MDVTIRGAWPEDTAQVVDLIHSAGPEALEYAFTTRKKSAKDFINAAFINGAGIIGFKNHVVAVSGHRVVGIGAFYNAADFDRLSNEMIWQIFRFYGLLKSWRILKRSSRLAELTPRPMENSLFIQNIAVAADMRGKGICTALLEEQIQAARQQNFRVCLLDVAVTNTRARRCYERLGFFITETRDWPFSEGLIQVPGQSRMALLL